MARTLRHLTTCCVALGLITACGGGEEAATTTTTAPPETTAPETTARPTSTPPPTSTTTTTATTEPPATIPPTTEEPTADVDVALGDTLVAEDGLLTMQIADGWSLDTLEPTAKTTYEDAVGLSWEASIDSLVEILSMTRDFAALAIPDADKVTLGVFREGRYRLVDSVFDWDGGVSDLLGISPNIDLTVEWAGGRGESTRGRLGTRYVRHESVQVGDQFVSVIAISPDQPDAQLDAEVSAMIESIQVDPSVLALLNHTIDLHVTISAEDSGSTPFKLGVLAPPSWVASEEVEGLWYDPVPFEDPETPLPSLDIYTRLVDGDTATMTATEFAERADDWFLVDPVAEETEFNDVPATIYWEGDPATTDAALVIVSDGVAFAAAYIYTPGDPALLEEMVASTQISQSAVHPDGI